MNLPPPRASAHARRTPDWARPFPYWYEYDVRASRDAAAKHVAALRAATADLESGTVYRGREVGRRCQHRLELVAASLEAAAARDEALLEWMGPVGERAALEYLAESRRQQALVDAGHAATKPTTTVAERAVREAEAKARAVEAAAELEDPERAPPVVAREDAMADSNSAEMFRALAGAFGIENGSHGSGAAA